MPATAQASIPPRSAGRWRCRTDAARDRPCEGGMRRDALSASVFAANRARGTVAFDVRSVDGVTRRGILHESGSLRVRFPSPEGEGLSAVLVNTAGGVAGGDRFDIEITVQEGARLT